MRTIEYDQIRAIATLANTIEPVRAAFRSYSAGVANVPQPQHLIMREPFNGALHIKSGHVPPHPFCLVKIASTFPGNQELSPSKPSINGLIAVFSSRDGEPIAVLEDRAWITQVRTAAAGAIATEMLATKDAKTLGVIGSGMQARLQAGAVLHARPDIETVYLWGRTPEHVESCALDLHAALAKPVIICNTPSAVAAASDILVTATYAEELT
ncbi:MAG: hypothetical protein GC161_07675 [Planctomycetaceae bacterium]|nr:hypothetical protein [Planctomycetaceae bacterium]